MAVTATYDLFKLKMLPALLDTFVHKLGIGTYHKSDRIIELSEPKARIILRSAESGGGLESSTAKAAWLDEAGQESFDLSTWEAVLRRLSIHQGRVLLTSTIYELNWMKPVLYDKWAKGDKSIDVIQFDSTMNPSFPPEEFERARETLPGWKFDQFYRGRYTRPAGQIYDCFVRDYAPTGHLVKPFALPDAWPRFGGLDFGSINTAALLLAHDAASDRYYIFSEYLAGNRTAGEHARQILRASNNSKGETVTPLFIGGSKSEGQWRMEFGQAGLPVAAPSISSVDQGISRVYGMLKTNRLFIFDACEGLIDELQSYSRKLDSMGEPTEAIEGKETYHRLDAARYILSRLAQGLGEGA